MKKPILILSAIVAFIAATGFIGGKEEVPVGLNVGERAPEIALPNPDSTIVKLSSLRGKGVSLDRQKDAWLKAIEADHLTWKNHVSDLKYWLSEAAALYKVQGIPTNWLIDAKGIIVAQNLRGPALEEALDKLVQQ